MCINAYTLRFFLIGRELGSLCADLQKLFQNSDFFNSKVATGLSLLYI